MYMAKHKMYFFFFTALVCTAYASALTSQAPSPYVNHFGTYVTPSSTSFRVWGPECSNIYIFGTFNSWNQSSHPLAPDTNYPSGFGSDYWSIAFDQVLTGEAYKYIVHNDEGGKVYRLDPWSREVDWSRGGSVVIDPGSDWTSFTRPAYNEMVLYELHVGTFNKSFDGIIEKIPYLKHLGVNTIQLMPSAEFGGDRSWGYNPEGYYAPESSYGGYNGWKRMVNALHSNGIAVLNDVVYNHCPGGEFLWQWNGKTEGTFTDPKFSKTGQQGGIFYYTRYPDNFWATYWGLNRPNYSETATRWFLRNNVMHWLDEMHADGLRFDSTITVRHIHWDKNEFIPDGDSLLKWMNESKHADQPSAITIAEDTQDDEWITTRPWESGGNGVGFDSQWHNPGVHALRGQMKIASDSDRDMNTIRDHIQWMNNGRDIALVKYISNHDENANGKSRLNVEMDWPDGTSYWAKKKFTLGSGIILTSVGIPMIFNGDTILMDKWFSDDIPLEWSRLNAWGGISECFRGMIQCRRNAYGSTKGLTGAGIYMFHVNNGWAGGGEDHKVIAFTRYFDGGGADDVLVILNCCNVAFPDYDLHAETHTFLNWDWYLQYTSNRKCYDGDWGGGSAADEAKHHVNNGHFSLGPYSVNIYGLAPLPVPQADFVVENTNGIVPRLVRVYNRSTSLPRWFDWQISGGSFSTNIAPTPNPVMLVSEPGTFDVSLSAYVQQDNTTQVSSVTTKTNLLSFSRGSWVNGAGIAYDVPPDYQGPLDTAVQDTGSDGSDWDSLAAVRVYTNDERNVHISVSGSISDDSTIVILLDTDPVAGTNVLPSRSGCTEVVRNMAGMAFDADFTPDKALVVKPEPQESPNLAWLDYSDINNNANEYMGSLSGFSGGASVLSNARWQAGLFNALPANKVTGGDALSYEYGLEIVAHAAILGIFNTNIKLQVVLTTQNGTWSYNQSLPGIADDTNSYAVFGPSGDKDYSLVPGNQYINVPITPGADDVITDANLQWPPVITTMVSDLPPVMYGRVYIPGKTGQGHISNLFVHAGVGENAAGMTWHSATYNLPYGDYSEYMSQCPALDIPGEYLYVFRYTYNDTNTVYGHLDGMHEAIEPGQAGTWVVIPEPAGLMLVVLFIFSLKRL
jgi:1,4-alpha-glucan branching enzyme